MNASYTEDEVILRIENVSKSYGTEKVLKNVSAVVRDIHRPDCITGQIVGFIGPSGVGKTTLFRIIAGLDQPSSGSVVLNGNKRSVKAGEVGVVAQSYPLLAHRTVLSNLQLAFKVSKSTHSRVSELLEEFDLMDCQNKYPSQLSGGQRQRCAILQQILINGHTVLLDEPFSGLDPIAKAKTIRLIQKVANLDELNTMVLITHDISAAVSCCDHLWLLGRDFGENGKPIPGAYIKETINLIDAGLCWHDDIADTPQFYEAVRGIEKKFLNL